MAGCNCRPPSSSSRRCVEPSNDNPDTQSHGLAGSFFLLCFSLLIAPFSCMTPPTSASVSVGAKAGNQIHNHSDSLQLNRKRAEGEGEGESRERLRGRNVCRSRGSVRRKQERAEERALGKVRVQSLRLHALHAPTFPLSSPPSCSTGFQVICFLDKRQSEQGRKWSASQVIGKELKSSSPFSLFMLLQAWFRPRLSRSRIELSVFHPSFSSQCSCS